MHLTQEENAILIMAVWGFIIFAYVLPAVLRFMDDGENPIADKIKLDFLEILLYIISFVRLGLGMLRRLFKV